MLRRIKLNAEGFARGSQSERNSRTSSHEIAALAAATFILVMTRSPAESGLTAIAGGIVKSLDQKSGFENAFPTGAEKTIGIANVSSRIRRVFAPDSSGTYQ